MPCIDSSASFSGLLLYETTALHSEIKKDCEYLQRRTLAMLRIGVLPLEIETGRYCKPSVPLAERLCSLCDFNTIEDEQHFLLCCPLYADLRSNLFNLARECSADFNIMSEQQKFVFLMSESVVQNCLTKTVSLMFNRRSLYKRR